MTDQQQKQESKAVLLALLQEMIDAGEKAEIPLGMNNWHCGTSCCLCGDVAMARAGNSNDSLPRRAMDFSDNLEEAFYDVFGSTDLAVSIYEGNGHTRQEYAQFEADNFPDILNEEVLNHPHLTTDRNDRAIAHDYVRLIMRKVEEL